MGQTAETRPLESVLEKLIDYRGKTPEKSDSGVLLITAKVIKDGRIIDDRREYIAEESYSTWMRRGIPEQNDIVITTEAPLGEVAQLRSPERIALAQRVILLRAKPSVMDQRYLFCALRSDFVRAGLYRRSTGTTVLGIKQSELRQVEIPYFPLPTQRRIASILGAYDDLIENNQRRIRILEEMAQRLYREWFVYFRFPGHHNTDSPLGPIPKGWEVKRLGELVNDIRDGVSPDQVDPASPYVGLEHIPRKSIALTDWGRADEVQSTKFRFQKDDILFGKIRPYFHKVSIAPFSGICSSDTIVIRVKSSQHFGPVLCCVSSPEFVNQATQTSNGTKMPRANWDVLVNYPIPLPPTSLLARFTSHVRQTVDLVNNLVAKNANLSHARNLLLPKLISGQLLMHGGSYDSNEIPHAAETAARYGGERA